MRGLAPAIELRDADATGAPYELKRTSSSSHSSAPTQVTTRADRVCKKGGICCIVAGLGEVVGLDPSSDLDSVRTRANQVSTTILLYLLVFGLLAALGNLLGGVLVTSSSTAGRTGTKRLLGVGAGFMLATVVLEVIPAVAVEWRDQLPTAMAWLLAGYLLIQLAEHAIAPHLHFGEEVHTAEVERHGVAATAVLGLAIHAFFDGVTIASGLLSSLRLGVFLALAVLIHKLPEGFTVASIVLSSGRSRQSARNATILVAAATFAGIILVTILRPFVPYTLPLSAGVTLYVAASDLIPEVNQEGGLSASLFVLSGVALFFAVELLVGVLAGH